ncbi:ribonuclease P protein component [Aquimarina sp. AD10]|uniref:Ribonuclease P protein component n=1 Tax=Aquimarina aggregata TaxID=1642818 RepID=A0A162Z6I5_9FLAO|nr:MULTISPECIES: ribonuclease P protein component [Aquimarina]AXT61906.1 ribonuclease P protein component [Aquimarina sp. AD10]KZS39582.1 ribonuclease P protein component [Aquimarina aggregata]RKN02366.1 ribonuclease P protein component [Aquimarina sp. AD10]
MRETFNKKERLKSKKEIELLFSEGKSVSKYPIRLVYRKTVFEDDVTIKTGVSVSKKHFKSAVKRNRIKRLLRESYRKNKYIVANTTHQFTFMFLYTGKELPEYALIETKIKKILQKFIEKEITSK